MSAHADMNQTTLKGLLYVSGLRAEFKLVNLNNHHIRYDGFDIAFENFTRP